MKPANADLQLLAEVGYSATARGMIDQARPIFDMLALCAPQNSASAIGYALGAIIRGQYDTAIDILKRDGVTAKEGADEAKAILMIALQLAGRQVEVQRLQRELSRRGPAVRNMARMFAKAEPGSEEKHSSAAVR